MNKNPIEFYPYISEQKPQIHALTFIIHCDSKWVVDNTDTNNRKLITYKLNSKELTDQEIENKIKIALPHIERHNLSYIPLETYEAFCPVAEKKVRGMICYIDINSNQSISSSHSLITSQEAKDTLKPHQYSLFNRVFGKTKLIRHLKDYNHVIWDWNGTIVDDVKLAVIAINAILKEHNLPQLNQEKYKSLFGFPVKNYYEKIGFDLSKHCLDHLSTRFHEEYAAHQTKHSKLFDDISWQLGFIKQTKQQSVLSAAAQWHLDDWVNHFNVKNHFDHIYGTGDHFASCKLDSGKRLLSLSSIDRKKTILIGDTDHDYDVAKQLGVNSLLIADGHQSYDRLKPVHKNVLRTRYS